MSKQLLLVLKFVTLLHFQMSYLILSLIFLTGLLPRVWIGDETAQFTFTQPLIETDIQASEILMCEHVNVNV